MKTHEEAFRIVRNHPNYVENFVSFKEEQFAQPEWTDFIMKIGEEIIDNLARGLSDNISTNEACSIICSRIYLAYQNGLLTGLEMNKVDS